MLLKIISARRCDEQEQAAVRVKGSDIQKTRECVAGKREGGGDCEHWLLCAKPKGETVYDKEEKKVKKESKQESKKESLRLCCVFTNKNGERCGLLL